MDKKPALDHAKAGGQEAAPVLEWLQTFELLTE